MRKFTKLTTTLLAACASLLLCTADVNAASGWVLNNGSWYYYGITTGIMQTGNLTDNGHLYYLRSDGRMATGTVRHPEGTYTYDASGALNVPSKGWYKVNGYYYYFINSNTVFTNGITPDGYYVNEYGQWLEGALKKGIDVSRYQETINWPAVAKDGISFAMIRIGSVKYGVDAQFSANMRGANNAGLRVGAYVYSYATTVEQAIEEANFAIRNLQNYTVSFPVAIDIESTAQKAQSPAQLAAVANAFCSTIKAAGYHPIVYSSKSWFTERIDTSAINYDLWVAQYNSFCTYPKYDMWQASSKGKVNGIIGNVDINYLYKDYFSLIAQTGWVSDNGSYYYYKNHQALTGLQNIDGTTYYFDGNGRMFTGWAFLNNKWHYFNKDGAMATGWLKLKDKWYYLEPTTGVMAEGWLQLGDVWHYLTPGSGEMLSNCVKIIDGLPYRFSNDGVWLP
ncbi:MAG: hypothetical protein J6B39_05325 [Lachnospiraceae bacterium]|nr:hypothetical protein [Lachnospiraceae bacterium]